MSTPNAPEAGYLNNNWTQPPARPACVGEHVLFDSTDPDDHRLAKAICAECPAAAWCAERAELLKKDHAHCRPLTGTWAGRLYGRTGTPVKAVKEPEPDYTDEQLRAFNAAYVRGETSPEVLLGARIYNRRRKAAAREARKVAA
jgi:hypothetical protein